MDFSESRKISHANLIKNLRTRADQKTNGKNDSQIKTCLVVQGGGMRAAYSMGCLLALDEFGYRAPLITFWVLPPEQSTQLIFLPANQKWQPESMPTT